MPLFSNWNSRGLGIKKSGSKPLRNHFESKEDISPGAPLDEYLGRIKRPLNTPYSRNTLSVCMIVKNEKDNIREAIESFQSIADEIIVNDTGSTDGTVEILKELDVTWIQSEWENDFSKARNQAIELASCAWIMWLDADDRIPPDQVNDYLKLKTAPLDRMFGLQVVNTQVGRPIGARFMQIRMFPNHPDMRFRFRVHEQIVYSGAKLGLHCIYVPTMLWHTGYENDKIKEAKANRNLELLKLDGDRIKNEVSLAASEGDSWFILHNYTQAIDAYKRALEIPNAKRNNKDVFEQLPANIGRSYQMLGDFEKAIEWLEKSIQANVKRSEPRLYLAECFLVLNQLEKAEISLRKALQLPMTYSASSSHFDMVRIFSFFKLSELLYTQKRFTEAIDVLEEMLRAYPDILEAQNLLRSCKAELGFAKPQNRLLLSLCMIVKNEEEKIGSLLSEVQDWVDEMVVVDTGSSDNTIEIAKSHGARVTQVDWVDDFSAARNRSLEMAQGKWILWLDADDQIPPTESVKLKNLLEGQSNPEVTDSISAWTFRICNTQDEGNTGSEFLQIRLFPNHPRLRFQFPVHEQILPALESMGAKIHHSGIKIFHTGYLNPEIIKNKQIRNLKILKKQIQEGAHVTPVTLFSLAGAHFDLGEFHEARRNYHKAMTLSGKKGCDPHVFQAAPIKAAACLAELGDLKQAYEELQAYFSTYNQRPDWISSY